MQKVSITLSPIDLCNDIADEIIYATKGRPALSAGLRLSIEAIITSLEFLDMIPSTYTSRFPKAIESSIPTSKKNIDKTGQVQYLDSMCQHINHN